MSCSARFSARSPPRLSRCRVTRPLEAGIGAAPARFANAASLRQRPGWDQDTIAWAALTGPIPTRWVRPGAMSSTRVARCFLLRRRSRSRAVTAVARRALRPRGSRPPGFARRPPAARDPAQRGGGERRGPGPDRRRCRCAATRSPFVFAVLSGSSRGERASESAAPPGPHHSGGWAARPRPTPARGGPPRTASIASVFPRAPPLGPGRTVQLDPG